MASFTKQPPILQGEELNEEWKQDRDIFSIHRFTERKTGSSSIFDTASEHMSVCSTFGYSICQPNRQVTSHYRQTRLNLFI